MNSEKTLISTDVDDPKNLFVFFGVALVIMSFLLVYFLLVTDVTQNPKLIESQW